MKKGLIYTPLLLLVALGLVACGEQKQVNEMQAVAQLKTHIDTLYRQDKFSGTVLIAKDKDILLHYSRGNMDIATGDALTGGEKFRLGSLNKMFTAVAIMMLAESGDLSLDDTLDNYLPDFENQTIAKNTTIRHLLTHSGGTGDIFGPLYEKHKQQLKTHQDYVELLEAREATHSPGDAFRYSNFGYILLGRIIEVASEQSYYTFLQRNLFTPAGMQDTGFEPETVHVADLTEGYMQQQGQWVSNHSTLPWRGTAAGGGYSTAMDLLRFVFALREGRLISPSMLKEASSKQVAMGDAAYGFGMGVFGDGPTRFYGHNGGAPGMSSWLSVYPNTGYTVIVLSNYDPPVADEVQSIFSEQIPFD